MRTSWITAHQALAERMVAKDQIDDTVPESAMPPYMESFLAHLRLLVGVPFDYLVPDSRLLPNESIRFFYLDRSWTDRLVDGAIAVGKIGTREQAHHQAHAANLAAQLDLTERFVRSMQHGLPANSETPPSSTQNNDAAGPITGFLLRSAAVVGWPHMDVRAFNKVLPANQGDPTKDPPNWLQEAHDAQLTTLRLELLSPSVMLGLFDGVPQLVWFEEPHHCVQFGFTFKDGVENVDLHTPDGAPAQTKPIPVPMRVVNRVVDIRQLRKQLFDAAKAAQALSGHRSGGPNLIGQNSSADFAIALLNLPWRQRFQKPSGESSSTGAFAPCVTVADRIVDRKLLTAVTELL